MNKFRFDWRVFAVALLITSLMPVKAMGWSLNHYVVKPWVAYYTQLLAAIPGGNTPMAEVK
jgi:hypothetical protein